MRYLLLLLVPIVIGCSTAENVSPVKPTKMIVIKDTDIKDGNSPFSKPIQHLNVGDTITMTGKWYMTVQATFKGVTGYVFEGDVELLSLYTAKLQAEKEANKDLDEIKRFGNVFFVPKDSIEDAWGRAQFFIAKHSVMKLQIATDYVLETYNTTDYSGYSYRIIKKPLSNGYEISVIVGTKNFLSNDRATQNSYVCSYYIKTGKEFSNLIWKY